MDDLIEEIERLVTPMLKRRLFVCYSGPADDAGAQDTLAAVPEHLEYIIGLEQRGVIFAAGPLLEGGEPGPRALYILRAPDEAAARALMDAEPMHRLGLRTYVLDEWSVNEGRITLHVDFSTQRGGLDGVPSSAPSG